MIVRQAVGVGPFAGVIDPGRTAGTASAGRGHDGAARCVGALPVLVGRSPFGD